MLEAGYYEPFYSDKECGTVVGRVTTGNCYYSGANADLYTKIAELVNRVAYLERKIAGLEGVIERYGERIDEIERLSKNIGVMTGVILEYPPRGNS